MWRPISVEREHLAEPIIPDVSTATGTEFEVCHKFKIFLSLQSFGGA